MFHGEHSGHVPRGTPPIDSQRPTLDQDPAAPRTAIAEGLDALGLHRDSATINQLAGLATLLSRWAPRTNLTGHRGAESIARRLILDAVALVDVLPEFEVLADLGSGAGFPGLPIAILFPDRRLVSVEARTRRIAFQKTAIRDLAIENATPILGRIESLDPIPADAVVAQAVAPPARVLEWMLPWCGDGGCMTLPGTADSLSSLPLPPRATKTPM